MLIARSRERQLKSGEELSREMRNIITQASSGIRKVDEVKRELENEVAAVAAEYLS